MSLTSEIDKPKRPVGAFFRERFPNTRALVTECNRSLRQAETIRPTETMASHEFGTLGTAIDYRLRYYFAVTPSQDLVAWGGAQMVNDRGSHGRVGLAMGDSFVELPRLPEEIVEGFFRNLDATLDDLQPVGCKLDRDAEALLNRYCVGLALFEQCFRAFAQPSWSLFNGDVSSWADLLQIAPAHWIDDLCAMSELFYDQMEGRFTEDAVLNPTFDGSRYVGGADADMILDSCLVDLKTTINAKIKGIELYQLLGYSLLDFSNRYGIEQVGFYLPRQGRFLTWQLEDLIKRLSANGPIPIEQLRSELSDIVGFPADPKN